jgi:hypothetical protein
VSETTYVTFKVLHVERIQGAGKLVALASVESLVRRAPDAVPEGLIAAFTADPGWRRLSLKSAGGLVTRAFFHALLAR